jgi:hypothetical protein
MRGKPGNFSGIHVHYPEAGLHPLPRDLNPGIAETAIHPSRSEIALE